MASIAKHASLIAPASFVVAPIVPPLLCGSNTNQSHELSCLQIAKSTPKRRFLRDSPRALAVFISSFHPHLVKTRQLERGKPGSGLSSSKRSTDPPHAEGNQV
jgi:hypothetical protein